MAYARTDAQSVYHLLFLYPSNSIIPTPHIIPYRNILLIQYYLDIDYFQRTFFSIYQSFTIKTFRYNSRTLEHIWSRSAGNAEFGVIGATATIRIAFCTRDLTPGSHYVGRNITQISGSKGGYKGTLKKSNVVNLWQRSRC